MTTDYYPLLFEPVLKDYIWGGRNLETRLGRQLPDDTIIAESWEIAAHKDGTAKVTNGVHSGKLLTQLLNELGLDLIGSKSKWALDRNLFPLLIKILDANRNLSVQVHPNDDYALENEGNELGKTEMWVVLHAEPDAEVILGVAEGTTPEKFEQAIADGALEPFMNRIPVQAGDHINVPAGSLHAILGGLLIAEIQQNSNTTYRVYDWNRVGHDGKPRPLHVNKAMDVTNFEQVAPTRSAAHLISENNGIKREILNETQYFTVERVTLVEGAKFAGNCSGETFEIWGIIDGAGHVEAGMVKEGLDSVQFTLIPAAAGDFYVSSEQRSTWLRAYVK
ncbi:MAG: type I phosphomannose isomerase catalytic subunit [Chloroflexota bacterium]